MEARYGNASFSLHGAQGVLDDFLRTHQRLLAEGGELLLGLDVKFS